MRPKLKRTKCKVRGCKRESYIMKCKLCAAHYQRENKWGYADIGEPIRARRTKEQIRKDSMKIILVKHKNK